VPIYEVDEAPVVARIHSAMSICVHGVDASEVRHAGGHFCALLVDYDGSSVAPSSKQLPVTLICGSPPGIWSLTLVWLPRPVIGLFILAVGQ